VRFQESLATDAWNGPLQRTRPTGEGHGRTTDDPAQGEGRAVGRMVGARLATGIIGPGLLRLATEEGAPARSRC
jgi:hypothetical protein